MGKMTDTTKTIIGIIVGLFVIGGAVAAWAKMDALKGLIDSTQTTRIGRVEEDVKGVREDIHAIQRGYAKIGSTLITISTQISTESRSRELWQKEQRSDIKEIRSSQSTGDQRLATIEQQLKNLERAD